MDKNQDPGSGRNKTNTANKNVQVLILPIDYFHVMKV
jgi:hypothetical protein